MKKSNILSNGFAIVILLSTIAYITMLITLTKEVLESCITDLLRNKSIVDIFSLHQSASTLLYFIVLPILILLMFRILRAILFFIVSISRTIIFIQSLPTISYHENIIVFESDTNSAFTAGFLKPKIYLSNQLMRSLSTQELTQILKHEQNHVKLRDPLRTLVLQTCLEILPTFFIKNQSKKLTIILSEVKTEFNILLAAKLTPIARAAISQYLDAEYSMRKRVTTTVIFSSVVIIFLGVGSFLGISVLATSDPITLCANEVSCSQLEQNISRRNLPSQCVELLYSPMSRIVQNDMQILHSER